MSSARCSALLITLCLAVGPTVAGAQPQLEWASSADGRWQDNDYVWNLDVHEASGTVFVAGESWGYDEVADDYAGDFLTAAFGADGQLSWTRIWGTPEQPWNFAWEMDVDQLNGVVATSGEVWFRDRVDGRPDNNYLAIGYDLGGNVVLESQYQPTDVRSHRQYGFVHNPVTGTFFSGVYEPGVSAIQWHADGAIDTFAEPPLGARAQTYYVAVNDLTGNSYVSGSVYRTKVNDFVASYDTAGNLRWYAERPVALNFSHPFDMVHNSATGITYVLLRQATSTYQWGFQVVAYDDLGVELWTSEFMPVSQSQTFFHSIAYDAVSDQVVISGKPNNTLETRAFDASTGADLWVQSYGDPAGHNYSSDMTIDAAGNIYIVARIDPTGTYSYTPTIISYDASGALRFAEPVAVADLSFYIYRVHVDGLLNIYVAGDGCFAPCPTDDDFVVVKYSQIPTVDVVASDVQELVSEGTLTNGEGNSMINKLNGAAAAIERGNPGAASGQLTAFIEQTQAMLLSGRISEAEAAALIAAAQAVIDSL